jgi:hypothetical protein
VPLCRGPLELNALIRDHLESSGENSLFPRDFNVKTLIVGVLVCQIKQFFDVRSSGKTLENKKIVIWYRILV